MIIDDYLPISFYQQFFFFFDFEIIHTSTLHRIDMNVLFHVSFMNYYMIVQKFLTIQSRLKPVRVISIGIKSFCL